MPLDHLVLVAKVIRVPEFHATIGNKVLGCASLPQCTAQKIYWSTTQSSCEKGLFTYPGDSTWLTDSRCPVHLQAEEVLPMYTGRHYACTLPSPYHNSTGPPRQELISLYGALFFATIAQEIVPDLQMWRPAGFTLELKETVYHLHTLQTPA